MIDRLQRNKLSQDLRRLVTGRMSNDDFDDAYFDEYESSSDGTVRAIAEFGYGLYSSDVWSPCYLKGRHRVSDEVRTTACRCVLFLRSDRQYAWPPMPVEWGWHFLWTLCMNLGLPGSIAMLIVAMFLYTRAHLMSTVMLAIPSLAVLGFSLWVLFAPRNHESDARHAWKNSGDWEAWPFLRTTDLEKARRGEVD